MNMLYFQKSKSKFVHGFDIRLYKSLFFGYFSSFLLFSLFSYMLDNINSTLCLIQNMYYCDFIHKKNKDCTYNNVNKFTYV